MSDDLMTWPKWLPRPQSTGYAYEPTDRTVSSDMEIGTIRRVEFKTDETIIGCVVILDQMQLAFFETFERDLLRQGTVWFRMPIFIAGWVDEYTVRFKERPKIGQFIGLHTTVTMKVQIEKRDLLDESLVWLLLYWSPEDIIYLSNLLHHVMHTNEKDHRHAPTSTDLYASVFPHADEVYAAFKSALESAGGVMNLDIGVHDSLVEVSDDFAETLASAADVTNSNR
jgi:hypothetical protein